VQWIDDGLAIGRRDEREPNEAVRPLSSPKGVEALLDVLEVEL